MKSKAFSFFVVFGVCCILYSEITAQPGNRPGKIESAHFYMKQGLPDEGVSAIVQDKKGFLWMGTFSGLVKFDGYKFTTFENNPFSSNSLANNGISSLWQDGNERLWIGHDEGVDIFDLFTETFLVHWYGSGQQRGDASNLRVNKIREFKNGSMWICTNQGVYVGEPEGFLIKRFDSLPKDLEYKDIIETKDGSIWASTTTQLLHFISKTKELTIYQHNPDDDKSLSNNFVKALYIDRSERLWVGTHRGANLFNPEDKTFTRYFPRLDIVTFHEDDNGNFLIGSEYGVFDLHVASGKAERITDAYYIFQMFRDRQGILWLATYHGLHQINPKLRKFSIHTQFNNNIGHILEDENHDIWMSTFRGVYKFDHFFRNVYQHRRTRPDLSNMVRGVYSDRRGAVWFGSPGKIERFDLKTANSDSIAIGQVTPMSIFVDTNRKIWIGTADNLGYYDSTTNEYQVLESSPKAAVHCFVQDSSNNVWAGTSAGLVRINIETNKVDVYKNDPSDPLSLSNNTVFNILIDHKGIMWVATDGGLNKVIPGTENTVPRFRHWRTSNSGIPKNNVYSILDARDGSLWMACGNMISHFYPEQNIFRNYDHEDGLPGRDIKEGLFHGRGLISSIGQIYFGTGWGVVVFHPDSLQENEFVPPVALTGFSIRNQTVPIRGTDGDTLNWPSPLLKSISNTQRIELTYDQNDFNFEFSALNFVNPANNQYRYKLEPYDKEWVSTDNRVANYTNISPGTYTFHVVGSNNDGIWNEAGTSIILIIKPPWWQTWWAYTLYASTFVGLIFSWRQYDIKRVKLKHRAEHLSELDQLKSRFFANISHEFRTPITLILGPLKNLYQGKSEEDPKTVLGTVIRNGQRLLRLINQLLDLSKVEAGKMRLHSSPVEVVEFLREIAASYESLALEKKIKYIFYPEADALHVYIDQEKIEKVVHNLLSNAFKFTSTGEIILNLKADKNHCLITVKDTGIGIPSDQLEKVFDRFYQVDSSQTRDYEGSGLGMALAKELVDLHKGKISVQSTEGKGTTFTVMLPLGKEHLNKDEITDGIHHTEREQLSDIVISSDIPEDENVNATNGNQPVLLIVEDNVDMRNYIRKTLSDQYQIVEAENGKSGLTLAQETIPDLMISDIMMPEMDGYKLCSIIKSNELTSHIPVILLTAKADRESKLSGLETGADDYLSKPFDADELKLIVRNRIEERRKMRERFSREVTLEPKQISITSLDEKFLARVLGIIEAHMDDENFSIDELSREAGFSNMHFYRKIKALSGETPSQFVRTIRLKRAAELLARNSDNVTQIAYSVGFSSLSYFNKCFKEMFGVTPGQYVERDFKPKS